MNSQGMGQEFVCGKHGNGVFVKGVGTLFKQGNIYDQFVIQKNANIYI